MLSQIKATAIRAAYEAGTLLRQHFNKNPIVAESLCHDIKLKLDKECEHRIKTSIHRDFPDHVLLSEESDWKDPVSRSEYIWVIDPLDGSINFFCGIPYFSVCVACCKQSSQAGNGQNLKPLVGVVYAPMTDDLYVGVAGAESQRNGRPLKVSNVSRLQDAVTGISFGSDEETMQWMEALNRVLLRRTRKIRILGSTGLDLVKIAEGRLSALIQGRVGLWDFIASQVILEQSGGVITASRIDHHSYQIMACAPEIYGELCDLLENVKSMIQI